MAQPSERSNYLHVWLARVRDVLQIRAIPKFRTASPTVIVVGYVTIDLLKRSDDMQLVSIGFGGVSTNLARVTATLGTPTIFYSPEYIGDLRRLLRLELEAYGVLWRTLPLKGNLSLFEAMLDLNGDVESEKFSGSDLPDRTEPETVSRLVSEIPNGSLVVANPNMATSGLLALLQMCRNSNAKFCLLGSSDREMDRIRSLSGSIDILSLNARELGLVLGWVIGDPSEVPRAVDSLLADDGVAIITFGSRGIVLVDKKGKTTWYQAVPLTSAESFVGAGDVLTGALIAMRAQGVAWEQALPRAARHVIAYLKRSKDSEFSFQSILNGNAIVLGPLERL